MKLRMGSQVFDVQIPLLWGTRAVLQDKKGRLSVVNLGGHTARLEILGDEPAPGIEFVPTDEGFDVFSEGEPLYGYNPHEKALSSYNLDLPDCTIGPWEITIGSNLFSGNVFAGDGVGIAVYEGGGIGMGAPLPEGLAALRV